MDGQRRTRFCTSCGQELSHAAFYRHLEDKSGIVCPGKELMFDTDSSTSDSSFDLDEPSSEEEMVTEMVTESVDHPSSQLHDHEPCSSSENENSEFESDDLVGEEIWDLSEDDDEPQINQASSVDRVLKGIALFLTKFQLVFRIPERAMTALLIFLRSIFMFLSIIIKHPLLIELCHALPRTMWMVKRVVGLHIEGVIEYTVCPKCHSLFLIADCKNNQGVFLDKLCTHIEYRNHPHLSRRSKCNTPLMKKVKVNGKSKLVPRKIYLYHNIIDSLRKFASKPNFLTLCECWRNRVVGENTYADVYDGEVWKNLQYIDGSPFLAAPNNLCLMMNVDWFNPYEESQYSAGAIYLTVLNLPRAVRYKFENILLVGLIPGPKEPSLHINSYLTPLVNDLNLLFHGITFTTPNSPLGSSTIRAMLTCICSDLPATRKLCGFLSHSASLGCSKCLKSFPSVGDKLDYSGFDCAMWKVRNSDDHKKHADLVSKAVTATARSSLERQYGLRYSALLSLPKFDIVRYHTIDPMHNIFLGIAKLCIKIWKSNGILKACHFDEIQCKVDTMVPPPNIGRIPRKISSGFSAFTADEWKHWILIYSMYALFGVLPGRDYSCWLLFVKCCMKLCKSVITRQEILNAHELLVEFCKSFQQLYGANACTPNLHMACHLRESLLDYGPLPAFWCFSFERYNGILEGMCRSWLSPEKQMFSKFLNLQYLDSLSLQHTTLPELDFVKIVSDSPLFQPSKLFDSVEQTAIDGLDIAKQMTTHTCEISSVDASMKSYHSLSYPRVEKVFTDTEMQFLHEMYQVLYSTSHFKISRFYVEMKQITVHSLQLLSSKARSQRSAAIAAHWRSHNGVYSSGQSPVRVGIVTAFLYHDINIHLGCECHDTREQKTTTNILARVNWLQSHPKRDEYIPGVIVCSTLQDEDSFIPVSRIAARCAIIPNVKVNFEYGEDNVCICVPLINGILV